MSFPVTTKRQAIALGNLIRMAAEREIEMAYCIQADSGRNMAERVVGVRAGAYAGLRDLYYMLPNKTREQFGYSCDTYLEQVGMGRDWAPEKARETQAEAEQRIAREVRATEARILAQSGPLAPKSAFETDPLIQPR